MDTKQPITLFVVAILVASVFSVVGLASYPLQTASAQTVTIETSADDHGMRFFGEGAVQVVIDDEDTDDDNADTIDVDIDVDGTSNSFTIQDTSAGSQRFEFFIVHEGSSLTAGDLDGIAGTATVITFGAGSPDLDTGEALFEEATIDIDYGDESVTLDYEETSAILTTDRDVYGSTSLVYILVDDQDGNINPTADDTFTVTATELNDVLFEITGADFVDDVTFEETGDNTAVFEGILQLNQTDTTVDPELDFTAEVVNLQLNDKADYEDITGGNNTSVDTSEVTFEIDDEDGEIDELTDLTFSGELVITVRDDDQNIDSDDEDTIVNGTTIKVGSGQPAQDQEEVDLEETEDNSGVFEFDLSNGELSITFLADNQTPTANNGILELRADDIEEDILVEYDDPLSDDSIPETTASFTLEMNLTPGQLSAPTEVGVTDEFTVTHTDPDLNDNPRVRDSYVIDLDGESPFNLTRGGLDFSEVYTFEIEVDGDPLDFTTPITVTTTETGINTGIFEFDIDVEDITDNAEIVGGGAVEIGDGDDIEITINDFMADTADPDEDAVTVTVGKPSVSVDFSRTTVPIPPEPGTVSEAGVGSTVVIQLVLVDSTLGTQSNVQELVDFVFGDDAGEWTIEVEGDDVNDLTIDEATDFFGTDLDCDTDDGEAEIVDGVDLCVVMGIDSDADLVDFLEETGGATGVFEADLEFTGDASMDAGDFQDAEFTFAYTDDEEEEESAGFTFRGNDGIVTVDQSSATTGTLVTITVEDQDLNLDDQEIDQFESGDLLTGTSGIQALLLIETEDEEIGDVDDDTFEETGEDTGVFTAQFEVGDDIPISDLIDDEVEQASNILITFDDEIDSTGGGGDELEVNVPVVSNTGSIQVTPELVGPATTLTVLVIDSDLDEDSASTDEYDSTDPTGDDFFVSFASSRNEVGEGSPDIEETGPNTGVFMFELELVTDEDACEDDDLDGNEFQAEGGDTDSTIGACPGDLISIRYEDEQTGGAGSATVSAIVEVMSWDPEFVADKESYSVGDRVTVTISDPDANRDSDIADSLTDIRVISDSDRVGEEFSAIETGRDTGVFRLSFGTSAGTAAGAISVSQGDQITIEYTDDFPADFEEEEEDKDFLFSVPVGAGDGGFGSTTVTPPAAEDVSGEPLDEISAGQQVILTTAVVNTNDAPQDFVAILEVRDSNGITVYLAWQTGTLSAGGQSEVGLSWTPDFPGDFTVRTFVVDDLATPEVLSELAESDITVS